MVTMNGALFDLITVGAVVVAFPMSAGTWQRHREDSAGGEGAPGDGGAAGMENPAAFRPVDWG